MTIAGCASAQTPDPAQPAAIGEGQCDAAKAQHLIGREGTESLGAEAMKLAGAGLWRFLRPGQIVTMEYRADRLNVVLDAQGKVEAIRCG